MSEFDFSREIRIASQTAAERATERAMRKYSTFWPFFIVLGALIFTAARDTAALYNHMNVIVVENARAEDSLKQSGAQAAFLDNLRKDLKEQAVYDPVVAQVVSEFFPSPLPPSLPPPLPSAPQKPGSPGAVLNSVSQVQKPGVPNATPTPASPVGH